MNIPPKSLEPFHSLACCNMSVLGTSETQVVKAGQPGPQGGGQLGVGQLGPENKATRQYSGHVHGDDVETELQNPQFRPFRHGQVQFNELFHPHPSVVQDVCTGKSLSFIHFTSAGPLRFLMNHSPHLKPFIPVRCHYCFFIHSHGGCKTPHDQHWRHCIFER